MTDEHDKVADPAVRDETTVLLRDLGKQLRDDERDQAVRQRGGACHTGDRTCFDATDLLGGQS